MGLLIRCPNHSTEKLDMAFANVQGLTRNNEECYLFHCETLVRLDEDCNLIRDIREREGNLMGENIINISNSSYGEYEKKLNIINEEGFKDFINELRYRSTERKLSGMVHHQYLNDIADTLIAFDKVEFYDYCVTSMQIRNLEILNQKSNLKMSDSEFYKWVLNGMINKVANTIDEDINYGVADNFFTNLKELLSLINITI